jgi:hypothetical protein
MAWETKSADKGEFALIVTEVDCSHSTSLTNARIDFRLTRTTTKQGIASTATYRST